MREQLLEIQKIVNELLENLKPEKIKLEPKKIKLEPTNLKINSDGWVKHTNNDAEEYLVNPSSDVREYKGNQYFTWDAAMRETKKLGKRLPTDEEMELLELEDYGEVVYTGYRDTGGTFNSLGVNTDIWSSTELDTAAWIRSLNSSNTTIFRSTYDKTYGFSVRCVDEKFIY